MAFPVDVLNGYSHEDLESSGKDYMSDLRRRDPDCPDFLSLPDHGKIPIRLSAVGFVPLYGGEQTHKVLALFAPEDSLTAVSLYLANQWWSIDDIVRTSVPSRDGLQQVKSVGERVVLYVLNRIIYRKQEIEKNEIPFLCHGSNEYAKIMWEKGEAVGFYSVKPTGSVCSSYLTQNYKLPVLDTMFVRKKHRGKDLGLMMLEDFVDSFTENRLGLRYPLSSFIYTVCKRYLEKYPGDHDLLWEVQEPGHWYQLTSVATILQRRRLKITEEASQKESMSFQSGEDFLQSAVGSETNEQKTKPKTQLSVEPTVTSVSIRTRSSHLKRPRIGKNSQESEPEISKGGEENTPHVSENRLEPLAHSAKNSEDLAEESEENADKNDDDMIVDNENQPALETELPASPPEKQTEKEETRPESFNGEVAEESGKTSLMAEEETVSEVLSGDSKLHSENRGEEPLTLFVPLVLEPPAKPSEDTVSDKVLNANNSEVLAEETPPLEKDGSEEEQQEAEKKKSLKEENAVPLAPRDEPSDNGLPNSVVTEAAEESASENMSPKTTSSVEEQNEEAGHNSQEASIAVGQSSLIVVEVEGVSFQQPSAKEAQKNQAEEQPEESAEQMEQHTQTTAERAADSSSEEAEIEVPIVDRRTLRRKAKGYKGPPKKKGKPA
ncbi:Soluble lamin-associated protein of 75 kDa [Tinamus guttatus]|uniref:Soluble lamin-associated protein of 75 kDa n=1 Tax=Tinamus guttatus TaxID=94827 RepID=A0A099ZR26_TINGU|nr:Soluble lamin-associated protein of 75 kDa [Tinamus guttatus]